MPAACGCVICKSSGTTTFFGFFGRTDRCEGDELLLFRLAMLTSVKKRPQARECVEDRSLPNGDTNDAPPRMSSQAPGTMLANGHEAPKNTRPPRPAAQRCHTMPSSWGRDPGPKYRFEVFHS